MFKKNDILNLTIQINNNKRNCTYSKYSIVSDIPYILTSIVSMSVLIRYWIKYQNNFLDAHQERLEQVMSEVAENAAETQHLYVYSIGTSAARSCSIAPRTYFIVYRERIVVIIVLKFSVI